jgi:hypothetical protein
VLRAAAPARDDVLGRDDGVRVDLATVTEDVPDTSNPAPPAIHELTKPFQTVQQLVRSFRQTDRPLRQGRRSAVCVLGGT